MSGGLTSLSVSVSHDTDGAKLTSISHGLKTRCGHKTTHNASMSGAKKKKGAKMSGATRRVPRRARVLAHRWSHCACTAGENGQNQAKAKNTECSRRSGCQTRRARSPEDVNRASDCTRQSQPQSQHSHSTVTVQSQHSHGVGEVVTSSL